MRILHLAGDLKLPLDLESEGASGVVRAALEIARAQAQQGHEVWIAAVGRSAWTTTWHGVRLTMLTPAPWARVQIGGRTLDFRVHLPYVALTRRHRFDVVQGHLYNYLRFLKAGVRIAHFHSDPFHNGNGADLDDLHMAGLRLIKQNSDAQVVVSRFIARQLQRAFGSLGDVHVVYNGVDAARFNHGGYNAARTRLRAQWGVKEGETVFLYAGAIVPEKGVHHLARAFQRLREQVPGAHLVLAGNSALWIQNLMADDPAYSYECEVRAVLEPACREGRVHFLAQVPAAAMPEVYAASDAVVIPSIWQEPFPLVALEAIASGCPVIASRVGGLPESVNDANGLLVPPGDEDGLQAAMHTLAHNPVLRQELGQGGRAQACRFSWNQAARELDALYGHYLQQKG